MIKRHNQYINCGTYYKIAIYKSHTENVIDYALISKEDILDCKTIFWRKTKYGYIRGYNKVTKRDIFLHKFILQLDSSTIIDHENRIKTDCRRNNLRLANKRINSINRLAPASSTTGFKGVSFDKRRYKYRAYLTNNQKQIFFGYFDKKEDAIAARIEGEKEYFKEYSIYNERNR